jgi:hypothetical protein
LVKMNRYIDLSQFPYSCFAGKGFKLLHAAHTVSICYTN